MSRTVSNRGEPRNYSLKLSQMKIDRVILATNEQELYVRFWTPVARAWRKLTNYTPTLIQVGTGHVDETLGAIIKLEPIKGIPTFFSAQVARLFIPALFPEQVSLISDIDMLPLNGRYYQAQAEPVAEDSVLIYGADAHGGLRYPMCYLAAKGAVFGEIVGLPAVPTLQDIQLKIQEWYGQGLGWHTDEVLFTRALHAWGGYPQKVVLRARGGWNPSADHQIDRANWNIDPQRLAEGYYIDAHLPRPYVLYHSAIRPLLAHLELNDLADRRFSALERLRVRVKYPWRDKVKRGLWRYVTKTAAGEIADPKTLFGKAQTTIAQVKGRFQRMASRFRRVLRFAKFSPAPASGSNLWGHVKQGLARGYPPILGYDRGAPGLLPKRALLTYVAFPFYQSPAELEHASHSNGAQALEIANALNRLGYVVDVVDWQDKTFVPTAAYDAFVGMYENFVRLLPYLSPTTRKIFFATRCHPAYETTADAARETKLEQRRGVRFGAAKLLREIEPEGLVDAVIAIGNDFVQSTFRERGLQVWGIHNPNVPTAAPDLKHKDFDTARRNFLWLGGNGLVHKGLDLVLEAFADLVQELWVCGELQAPAESEFVQCYRRELFHTPTIHSMGWVDIHSAQFRQVTDQCAFVILLSASDAMPTSVLVAMGQGLIPIVSREVGFDTADFGFTIDAGDILEIRRCVDEISQMPLAQCRAMSARAYAAATTRYTYAAFGARIEQILEETLNPT